MDFNGTNNGETINGTAGDDRIYAGGGNDTANGAAGADLIEGGTGNDVLNGGTENDILYGQEDNDTLNGGAGTDQLYGGDGNDTLVANLGADALYGGLGVDVAQIVMTAPGTANLNTLYNAAAQTLTDTVGNVHTLSSIEAIAVQGSTGVDTIIGSNDISNRMFGLNGNDTLTGAALNDVLIGGVGDDTLTGNGSNDYLQGDAGNDTLYGGDGTDMAVLAGFTPGGVSFFGDDASVYNAATDQLTNWQGNGIDTLSSIERLQINGNVGNDVLVAGDLSGGRFEGLTLSGLGGNDQLEGDDGTDVLIGGAGNDGADGGRGLDTLVMTGNRADYTLTYDADEDAGTIVDNRSGSPDGTDAFQRVEQIQFADQVLVIGTAGVELLGTDEGETLTAGDGSDDIEGFGGSDQLYGGAGSDDINGGDGDDTIYGGAGNDGLDGEDNGDDITGDDTIYGGSGNDDLAGGPGSDILYGEEGDDRLIGEGGSDDMYGGDGDDLLDRSDDVAEGDDSFDGGSGNDRVVFTGAIGAYALAFDDDGGTITDLRQDSPDGTLYVTGVEELVFTDRTALAGSAEADSYVGTGGDDTYAGMNGDDTIAGQGGNDALYGGGGNDTLDGGEGNDLLDGGTGTDSMTGGAGDDTYVVDTSEDSVVELADGGTDTVQSRASGHTLAAEVENLTFVVPGGYVSGSGNALANTLDAGDAAYASLDGSDGDDTLDAVLTTDGASLSGGEGNDRLYGGVNTNGSTNSNGELVPNSDYLDGGAGDDIIVAGGGLDQISGGAGNDQITGSDSSVAAYIDEGGNYVSGLGDYIDGGDGDDTIDAGAGDDTVYGGTGQDVLRGGAGNDSITVYDSDGAADTIQGGEGNDALLSSSGGSSVSGGAGSDFLYTYGGAGASWDGGEDEDTFYNQIGDAGIDTLTGGAGSDRFRISLQASPLAEDVITDFTAGSGDGYDVLDIVPLLGSFGNYHYGDNPFHDGHLRFEQDGDDTVLQINISADGQEESWVTLVRLTDVAVEDIETNNLYPDFARNGVEITVGIETGDDSDIVGGSAEDDTITTNGGDDLVIAGFGDDTVYGGDGTDRIDGSDGADTLYGGEGDDVFGDEPVPSDGGGGVETLAAPVGPAALAPTETGVNLADYRDFYLNGDFVDGDVDTFTGGAGADVYHLDIGQSGVVDVITDFAVAEDVLTLGNIQRRGYWSDGDNPFATGVMAIVQDGDDTLVQLYDSSLVRLVGVQATSLTAANFNGLDPNGAPNPITGTDDGETLYGTNGADAIDALGGSDDVYAYGGADTIFGGDGADSLHAGSGADTISAGTGADQAYGESGADLIEGGVGDDQLSGGDGDDVIHGGEDGVYVPVSDNGLPAYFGALDHDLVNGLGGTAGFGEENVGRNDDGQFNLAFPEGFGGPAWTVDGSAVSSVFVSNNGYGSLGALSFSLFSVDLDTRAGELEPSSGGNSTGSNLLWYDFDSATDTITLTYDDVGRYRLGTIPSAFQIQIHAVGGGDFDVVMRYEDTGFSFPGGSITFGNASYTLPVAGQNPDTATGNLGVPGVWAIQIRGGQIIADNDHGDGDDSIDGGAGDDIAYGGTGNDRFEDTQGSNTLHGGEGADSFLNVGYGEGEDSYTGGDGRDSYQYRGYQYSQAPVLVTVTDFATGDAGDAFDLSSMGYLPGYSSGTNPFQAGYARLVQDGADTLLAVDYDGEDGTEGSRTIVRFQNTVAGDFTAANFAGYDPATPAGQVITGTDDPETLDGGPGDDTITALDGSDTVNAGAGADTVYGGGGNDTVYGGSGADQIDGGEGQDTLIGGGGGDTITTGGDYYDRAWGEDGNDTLTGGGNTYQELYGGSGDDIITTGAGGTYVEAGGGSDTVYGGDGGDNVYGGGGGTDTLYGGAGADSLRVYGGSAVYGGTGDDYVELNGAANTADAGDDNDTVDINTGGGGVIALGAGDDLIRDLGDDSGTADRITGGAGRDTFRLNYYAAGNTADIVTDFTAGPGGDVLDFQDAYSRVGDNGSNPFLDGRMRLQDQSDGVHVQFDLNGDGIWVDAVILQGTTAAALTFDNFVPAFSPTGAGATINDTDDGNTLYGTANDDVISGNGGNDTVYAGDGDDEISGGEGSDYLAGGRGNDTITTGGDYYDRVVGDDGDDVITGGGNTYQELYGGNGNDTITAGAGGTYVDAGSGNDTFYGGDGGDNVYGGSGIDTLYGNGGGDSLRVYGGSTVYGGTGADYLELNNAGNTAEAGDDNDSVDINYGGGALIDLGAGDDFIRDLGDDGKDQRKIDLLLNGVMPIYEPGLDELVERNVKAGRLRFTTDLAAGVKDADAVFIAVGTPSRRGDGHADLSYVHAAAKEIGEALTGFTVIVDKSTVPVGTGDEVERIIREANPNADFAVASNPEFLREGAAIDDFKRPDRIVIGSDDPRALEVLRQVYRPLYLNKSPIVEMSRRAAELTKYAGNAFLATKITFINEIADLCEKVGADVQDVARGIGLDGRIGSKFLHAGPGYGGSCFPKDTLALLKTSQDYDAPQRIVEAVVAVNDNRKRAMGRKVITAMGGDVRGKTVAVLGLTFKPNTDDMRDSPAIAVIQALQDAGATVRAYDPEGHEQAKKVLDDVVYCDGVYQTMEGADALAILTEWDAFRALDFKRVKALLSQPILVDLRNVYSRDVVEAEGFSYTAVGR